MNKEYIVKVSVGQGFVYRVGDTRVSLDSIVHSWLQGDSAETIAENFPALTLEQVYGAVAFYLANQAEVDEYLRQGRAEYEQARIEQSERLRVTRPQLYQKLLAARQQVHS